jgi:hypothetical protein
VGQAEGAKLDEDELLGRLREEKLITYASPLLSFLEEYPDLFTDVAVFAQVGPPLLAAVVASGLPRAGKSVWVPLKLVEFCGSVGRLAWARVNACPWDSRMCSLVAGAGHLGVLQWAREQEDVSTNIQIACDAGKIYFCDIFVQLRASCHAHSLSTAIGKYEGHMAQAEMVSFLNYSAPGNNHLRGIQADADAMHTIFPRDAPYY